MYKLLIVDDNQTHIDCVKDYIDWEELNFTEIRTATNGKDAMDIFGSFKPNLVITDIVMPLSDGISLAENIRAIDKSVHIIFMSCYEEFEFIKQGIDNDITAYILKPIDPDELRKMVLKVIESIEASEMAKHAQCAIAEFLPLARESLLYRFLYQENPDVSEELLSYAHFSEPRQALIIKYAILKYNGNYSSIYEMLGTAETSFKGLEVNAITEIPNKIIILLSSDEEDSNAFLNTAIDALRLSINETQKKFNLELVAGVSNIFSSLKQAHTMLKQANLALENAYSPQAGEIYFFEDFEGDESETADYDIYNLKHDLAQLLDSSDKDAVESFMNKYYPRNASLNRSAAKGLCFATITTLQLLMTERNADINDMFESPNIIWTKLNKFETIADTYQWLKNILTACMEFISDVEKETKHKVIKDIEDYIDIHFKDISSVSQIASELFISTGYAKNVFKKHTGQTIFDYLVDRRIKEAKKLLSDPTMKVYEVSQLVGYTSKSHFAETFKRKTGMTPKEFQQRK